MIKGVEIKILKKFTDDRGWLIETFRNDELPKHIEPQMSYVSMTKPGIKRGPHEHEYQTDIFVFIGPGTFELHLWDNRPDSPTFKEYEVHQFGEKTPAQVIVPNGVVHGYKNVSKKDAMSLNYPDKLFKGVNKKDEIDEIRHEDDPKSEFKIE